MKDACLEQAALACVDAATFTPPMPKGGGRGLSNPAKLAGFQSIAGDVAKMFVAANDRSSKSASALLTNQLAYATKTNDISLFNKVIGGGKLEALKGLSPIMRKIANDQNYARAFSKAKNYFNTTNPVQSEYGQGYVTDLRSIHNKIKGKYGGRIGRNVRPVKLKMLVETTGELKTYVKDRQQMVGMVKAGWLTALLSLPKPVINGIPKNAGVELTKPVWIARHLGVPGRHALYADQSVVELSVTNSMGNINNVATDADTLELVYGNRIKQMRLRFAKHFDKTIERANRR